MKALAIIRDVMVIVGVLTLCGFAVASEVDRARVAREQETHLIYHQMFRQNEILLEYQKLLLTRSGTFQHRRATHRWRRRRAENGPSPHTLYWAACGACRESSRSCDEPAQPMAVVLSDEVVELEENRRLLEQRAETVAA